MDRIARLLNTSTRSSRILEIGPSHAPAAPKSGGWNTFVVDHTSREELKKKFAHVDVNLDAIEEVDGIWQGGPLQEAVPTQLRGSFDTLIASHVIEHIPDLAGFLVSAQQLLTATGVVALAIPDRRFCFDYFKPQTMTGDVLEAHVLKRSRHALHTVWNQTAYSATWDNTIAWGQHPIREPAFMNSFAGAEAGLQTFSDAQSAPYVDCHSWHFTPAGFSLVVLELAQLGIIDWHLDELYGSEGCEFFAFLRRGANPIADPVVLQERRMGLLREQLVEMRDQVDFVLGASAAPATGPDPAPAPRFQVNGEAQQLAELTSLLRDQQTSLREIQITAAWVREILRPARVVRRIFRGSRP